MDIIPLPKKNVILDASILSSLMSCPRLTDFRYNHNLVSLSGKSNSLECGSIVHKFLEYYYKGQISRMNRTESIQMARSAAELYITGCQGCSEFIPSIEVDRPKCGHQPNEFPGVKNTPPESEKYLIGWKYALDTCHQYIEYYKNDHWVSLEAEVVKGEILYENDDIRVLWKAKFDWIVDTNDDILPVDHKTMKQRRDKISLNNQFTGQCLLMKTRKVIINKIGFQTTLKPEEKFIREIVNYSSDRLIEWQSEILPYYAYKLLDYTEQAHWPPNYTHCENIYGKCQFVQVCEADRNMRGEELRLNFIKGSRWDPTND
jgi:hypothetical protein